MVILSTAGPPSAIAGPSNDGVNQELLMRQTFEELKSCKSYWIRQSKFLALANRSILSAFQLQLIEFDIALFFRNIEDAAAVADKIFPPSDPAFNFVIIERMRTFLSIFSDPHASGFRAIRKVRPENLVEMCFCVYADQTETSLGRLSLYVKLALLNPATSQLIASKLWEDFSSVLKESAIRSSVSSILKPLDLIFLHIAPSFVDANFGDLSACAAFEIYHRLLSCTLQHSLGKIPKDYYRCGLNEKLIDSLTIDADKCWNICASFIAAIYRKFGRGGVDKSGNLSGPPRQKVSEILSRYVFVGSGRTNSMAADFSFVDLVEDLLRADNYKNNPTEFFDVEKDVEIFRLLVFYALAQTRVLKRRQDVTCDRAGKIGENLFVLAPRFFCDISPQSITDFWQNEEESENFYDEMHAAEDEEIVIKGNSAENVGCFRILFALKGKLEVTGLPEGFFENILGAASEEILADIGIVTTFLQAQMFFANYQFVVQNLSKMEKKTGLAVCEKRVLNLQHLQTCVALKRHDTIRKLRYSGRNGAKLAVGQFGSADFQRCVDFVIAKLDEKDENESIDDNERVKQLLPTEISIVEEENCYISIEEQNIRSYSILCLFHIIWCELLENLTHKERRNSAPKLDLSSKIDFLIAFSLCTIQLILDEVVCFPLFEHLLQHITREGRLNHIGLIDYLCNPVLLSYIFALEDNVHLNILSSTTVAASNIAADSGSKLAQLFLDGTQQITNKNATENFKKFIQDNQQQIKDLFECN